ncbi:MAG TPA: asparagine synthase (glutamine-hydrolyzing) [Beijerinckiaceae bacterium]|nr:asparagine synthase (glutamine-hydrolyzing) [Beijerinckiaceae bacterium]
MCGFAGLVQRQQSIETSLKFRATAQRSLGRRGPDDFRAETVDGVELIHARLSIIDLANGQQPRIEPEGAIAFNGEIYNHADLHLPGVVYQTTSDTEVLLKGMIHRGLDFLRRADGMFAFAYLDRRARKIYLVRDLFGIKPAYFIHKPDVFAFASTIPSLMAFSDQRINPQAYLEFYLARGARGTHTLFADIHEVAPGQAVVYDLASHSIEVVAWESRRQSPERNASEADLLAELDDLLHRSVQRHLVSDVPVASLLSGGIDSGLLTAIAARYVPDMACFSIGFTDKRYDESPHSKAIAEAYNLRHFVKFVDGEDLVGMLEDWPTIADDASAEPASVMRYLVARYAHDSGFKVVLSGEGADEFFGGYNQYRRFQLARQIGSVGRFFPFLGPLAERFAWPNTRLVHYLMQATRDPSYYGTSMIFEPYLIGKVFQGNIGALPKAGSLRDALFLDQRYRLADDLLTITDRSTMHASIEARVPFITRTVADFATSLPESMLVRGSQQKYLLRKLALKYLPHEAVERPKVGFDMPLGRWLRTDLRPMVEDALDSTWQSEFIQPGAMRRIVDAHMAGKADFADKIWAFITLERNVKALKAMA